MPNKAMRTSGRLGMAEAQQSRAVSSSKAGRFRSLAGSCYSIGMASATLASHDGEELLFEGRAALVPSFTTLLAAILTLGLWLIVRWFQTLGRTYRITT